MLILPFIEQLPLFRKFHLDEPWDSEHNRKLVAEMPDIYRSPGSKISERDFRTNYVVPVGPHTEFTGGPKGLGFKDVKDGVANTFMILEVDDAHAVVWTKPEDLTFDSDNPTKGLGGLYEGGFWVAFCDGSTLFIRLPMDATKLRALFTRNGGENVSWP